MLCSYCNDNILEQTDVYKAFDMYFCSNFCRYNVTQEIANRDPHFMDHYKWKKIYSQLDNNTNIPSNTNIFSHCNNNYTIKKTTSCYNLDYSKNADYSTKITYKNNKYNKYNLCINNDSIIYYFVKHYIYDYLKTFVK